MRRQSPDTKNANQSFYASLPKGLYAQVSVIANEQKIPIGAVMRAMAEFALPEYGRKWTASYRRYSGKKEIQ